MTTCNTCTDPIHAPIDVDTCEICRILLDPMDPEFIVSVRDDGARERRSRDGYGGKLTTPYIVRCADGRERRVWAMCYGNAASHYIIVDGREVLLSIEAEFLISQLYG